MASWMLKVVGLEGGPRVTLKVGDWRTLGCSG